MAVCQHGDPMNILLIGCGAIGKRHLKNLLEIVPDAKITVLAPDNVQNNLSDVFSATVIRSWDEIDKTIDLVIVANPSALHAIHIAEILKRNIPAYIEKPLVTTHTDLQQINTQLRTSDFTQPTMIGCNLRFLPSVKILKKQLENNVIGNVCRAIFEVGQYLPQWQPTKDYRTRYSARKSLGGGVIYTLVHELDLVRYLLGEFSVISSQYDHLSHLEIDVEDTAVIHLGRPQGPFVSVHLDYVSQQPTQILKSLAIKEPFCGTFREHQLLLKRLPRKRSSQKSLAILM